MLFFGTIKVLKDDRIVLRNVNSDTLEKAKDRYHELLREKNKHLDEADKFEKELKEMQEFNEEILKNFELNQQQEKDEK